MHPYFFRALRIVAVLCLFITSMAYSQECPILYVSANGTGLGTINDPMALSDAIDKSGPGTIIKMAKGFYPLSTPLQLKDSITIEGGFSIPDNWTKTSAPGATTIQRSAANPEGPITAPRIVAIYGNNIKGFRLHDLTITTSNISQPGVSTYGMHLTACSDYEIVRCQILAGKAGNGKNGITGQNGRPGSSGDNGQRGYEDQDNIGGAGGRGGQGAGSSTYNGGLGAPGGTSLSVYGSNGGTPTGINGGGGGGGGGGGHEDRNGGPGGHGGGPGGAGGAQGLESGCNSSNAGCSSTLSGKNGLPGASGINGVNGANGISGSIVNGFWIPGSTAANGQNGTGGAGGGGGGGGAGEGGIFCTDGHGSGGGGGGGGGQAGTGGEGGSGGGSSFGLYLYLNGENGYISQTFIRAGQQGTGGQGGRGGTGALGGSGGLGSRTGGEIGCGGNGGPGGKGGNGGKGGDGSQGRSLHIVLEGNELIKSETNENISAQPIITASLPICADSITYEATEAGLWDLGQYSSVQNADTLKVTTAYSRGGRFDIEYGAFTYEGFVHILNRPHANAGEDQILCNVDFTELQAILPESGIGVWQNFGVSNAVFDDPFLANTNVSALEPGHNKLIWAISSCCPLAMDTVDIMVSSTNTGFDTIVSCGSYTWIDGVEYLESIKDVTHTLINEGGCDSVVTLNLTINSVDNSITTINDISFEATEEDAQYQWVDCNNGLSPIDGENNKTFTATSNGQYAVEVTKDGCTGISDCYVVSSIVGLKNKTASIEAMLLPNPAERYTILKVDSKNKVNLEIIDFSGNIFLKKSSLRDGDQLDLKNLPEGVYFARVISNEGIKVLKLVIR